MTISGSAIADHVGQCNPSVATRLYPSRMWADAAGVKPLGAPWCGPETACVLCGAPVAAGSPATLASTLLDDAFTNFQDCRYSTSKAQVICGHCLGLWKTVRPAPNWMQSHNKTYAVQGRGVYFLRRDADIAAFFLKPPAAPYVAIYCTRQQAHMIWRAQVNLPGRYLRVQLDDHPLEIDREHLLKAWKAWDVAREILRQAYGHAKARPYVLSRNMSSVMAGVPLHEHTATVAASGSIGRHALQVLDSLSSGEWWALNTLADKPWLCDDPSTWPEPRSIDEDDDPGRQE